MRALPLILLAACGSSAPPPATPLPPEPTPVAVESAAEPAQPEQPAAPVEPDPAPPAAPKPPLHERLRDQDGPIAGLPGFSIKRTPNTSHCGGVKITTKRSKKIAPADKQLAEVFALEFPTGLTFDPDPKHKVAREKSLQKFNDFIQTMTRTGGAASSHYADQVKVGADESTRTVAIARIVQIQFRLASVLARAEIPKDVRTGEFKDEKVAAFCDRLVEVSEPLLAQAESALELCVTTVKQASTTGWWNDVCGETK